MKTKKVKVWWRPTVEHLCEIVEMRYKGEITSKVAKELIKKFSIPHVV